MEYDAIAVITALLLNAISNIFDGFQAYQARKSHVDSIDLDYQKRYTELLDKAQDFYSHIENPNFDLKKIKSEEVKKDLVHWAEKYFRLCFEQWRASNVSKSIPKYISKGWDAAIQDALKKPFFQQMWEEKFRERSFNGFAEFNEYVEKVASK